MDFSVDCRWTDNVPLSDKYIEDFLFILQITWSVEDKEGLRLDFENRYYRNIYGPSLLTMIYCDGKPASCGAMWRNDIGDRRAYQHIDTCTLEEFRGQGLFRKGTEKALELIGEETLSYGFANPSSLAGYLKFGWDVLKMEKPKIMFSARKYLKSNPAMIDAEYAGWYLTTFRGRILAASRSGKTFLVIPTSRNRVYQIIGCAQKEAARFFAKAPGLSLLVYSSIPTAIDSTRQGSVVVARYKGDVIPLWKSDAL